MVISRKKRTPLCCLKSSSAQLSEKWLHYKDIFQTSNSWCGMSSEEGQGICFWLFWSVAVVIKHKPEDSTTFSKYRLCRDSENNFIRTGKWHYWPLQKGWRWKVSLSFTLWSCYICSLGTAFPLQLTRDLQRSSEMDLADPVPSPHSLALASLWLWAEPPLPWDPVARQQSQPLALVAKRACFTGQTNYKVAL